MLAAIIKVYQHYNSEQLFCKQSSGLFINFIKKLIKSTMALVNVGSDSWALEYKACERLSREIMEQLHAREEERPGTVLHDSLTAKIRVRLKQHVNEINQLRDKLQIPNVVSQLTDDEKNRRLEEVEKLQASLIHLQDRFGEKCLPGGSVSNVIVNMGTIGWGEDEEEEIRNRVDAHRNLPIPEIQASHAEMLRAQDEGLAELSQVIGRQKRIANVISGEVDDHNAILDDISNHMDRVDVRVQNETQTIRTITRKDKTCGYWVVIILLFVAIMAVGFS